ncbi:hypothetical protein BMW23_0848 [Bodo saltans virus]|uniref:Uncharacterized protein n=1 Tax=Bodo saltans virus TaxID=2024608 RepID=A0A2H4UVJ9_9VIRU|nr:hypothetical protein QJ851_gp0831 [Bodo saltans virus]ATZ80894.1 hypothetical protein BMW23_0848 [Bodo saltans virus]
MGFTVEILMHDDIDDKYTTLFDTNISYKRPKMCNILDEFMSRSFCSNCENCPTYFELKQLISENGELFDEKVHENYWFIFELLNYSNHNSSIVLRCY